MVKIFSILLIISSSLLAQNKDCEFTLARLKYEGGGDWYANPSALPNLAKAVKERTDIPICNEVKDISLLDKNLFRYPFIYATGHGIVKFSAEERVRLRKYLERGGFFWADDNYGLDESFRKEMKILFPDNPLVEIPANHSLFSSKYKLKGVPKIHEHDGKPAKALAIYFNNQLVVLYTYSADIGDGMEDLHIHNDGEKLHELALRMGINVISWFFNPE